MKEMFRKIRAAVFTVILLTAFLTVQEVQAQSKPADFKGNLTVWSFNDELTKMTNNYIKKIYKGINFSNLNYAAAEDSEYVARLDTALASRSGVPDVMALESAFVRRFVESGKLLDLTDIYEANKNKLLAYPAEVGTYNGRVYALSWQACPGAMFYRRSLAKKYLGTDDPAIVQTYFTNINKFMETAKLLKEKSQGNCFVTPGPDELRRPFQSMRANPWVVNGKFVIDPVIEQYLDVVKILADNGWIRSHNENGMWTAGWFAGMKGELKQENGSPAEIFAYFLPSWGIQFVLKTGAPATSGDWAMIQGPIPYSSGGTWLAVNKDSANPQLAKEFIRYITTDDSFMEKYAKDSGDIVSNIVVQERIKSGYKEKFLNNQNHYLMLSEISRNINGRLIQSHDDIIEQFLWMNIDKYLFEGKTKAQFLAEFRAYVKSELGF